MTEITVDHLRFETDAAYRAESLSQVGKAIQPGMVVVATMLHEADDSCCRLEAAL
jgi:hypothetical protein